MSNEDELGVALLRINAKLDAMASMLLALTVTVCRANPRAQKKIEEMAIHHQLRHIEMAQDHMHEIQLSHMQSQLEVLLQSVRLTLKADAVKKK